MINSVFGKTMKNLGKRGDIKLVKTDKIINYLFSQPNYHTIEWF